MQCWGVNHKDASLVMDFVKFGFQSLLLSLGGFGVELKLTREICQGLKSLENILCTLTN